MAGVAGVVGADRVADLLGAAELEVGLVEEAGDIAQWLTVFSLASVTTGLPGVEKSARQCQN